MYEGALKQLANDVDDTTQDVDTLIAEDVDITAFGVIQTIKDDSSQRTFHLNPYSLRNRVLETADKGVVTLIRPYGVGEDETPGPSVEM